MLDKIACASILNFAIVFWPCGIPLDLTSNSAHSEHGLDFSCADTHLPSPLLSGVRAEAAAGWIEAGQLVIGNFYGLHRNGARESSGGKWARTLNASFSQSEMEIGTAAAAAAAAVGRAQTHSGQGGRQAGRAADPILT